LHELDLTSFLKPVLSAASIRAEIPRVRAQGVWSIGLSNRRSTSNQPVFLLIFARTEAFSQRGELDFHQKLRAVDAFYRYLWNERNKGTTPFNEGPQSGANYVLQHILSAIDQIRHLKSRSIEQDILDY